MPSVSTVSTVGMEPPTQFKAIESYKTFFDKFDEMHKRMLHEWNFLEKVNEQVVQRLIRQGSYKIEFSSGPVWQQEHNSMHTKAQKKCEALRIRFSLLDGNKAVSAAECNALLIHTKNFRHGFFNEMDDISRESSVMAKALCDNKGRPRKEIWNSSRDEGTGVTFDTLENNNLVLIEFLHVAPNCRRNGIGSMMVQAMLKNIAQRGEPYLCISAPDHLKADGIEHFKKSKVDADKFMRSMGFRKIGSSDYFSFSPLANKLDKMA